MNKVRLITIKFCLLIIFQLIAGKQVIAQLEYPGQVDTLGSLETIFDFSAEGIANDYPDAPARAFRDASGQIQLLSTHYDAYRMKGNDFNSLSRDYANGPVYTSANNTNAPDYDYRTWIASPYTLDGITIHSINHHEYFGPVYNYYNWQNTITYAVSTDTGKTYQQPNAPLHLVWTLPYSYTPAEGPCGYFNPSNIIYNWEDGYYYCYLHLESRIDQQTGVGLIRTNDLADPSSWKGWDGSGFNATSYDPYQGGSPDPLDHVLTPLNDLYDNIGTMSSSITYNTYFNKWMLVGWSTQVINGVPVTGAFYSLSADMIRWSQRRLIRQFTGIWGSTYPSYNYPSIIDHADTSRNFSFSGQDAYLYFTRANSANDRDLVRIPVRFNKNIVTGFTVGSETDNITSARDAMTGDGYAFSKIAGGTTVTLRSAIEEANMRPPYYQDSVIPVHINIPGAPGSRTITLGIAELPEIKYPVMLNGYAQSGSSPNTAGAGEPNNAVINTNLDCNGNLGLALISHNSTVKGMAIYNANGTCISISEGNGNKVQGCYIGITGTGMAGTYPLPGISGIDIGGTAGNGSSGNIIGGSNAEDQNVIAGGINIRGSLSTANTIQGNYIGTDRTGMTGIDQNSNGIGISDSASFTTIGGIIPSMRNVISGNQSAGISINGIATGNNTVLNNYIGLSADASSALPNQSDGIVIQDGAHHNIIGLAGFGNIIAGGNNSIISIDDSPDNTIAGNYIGTDTSESIQMGSPVGVQFKGLNCNNNKLGGDGAGEFNVIANADFGVITFGSGYGNAFLNNIIHNISEISIDLAWDGMTLNDYQDTDPDPQTNPNNYLQNYPEIVSADSVTSGVHILANFNSTPLQTFNISFFASSTLTGTGLGHAERFIGNTQVNTDANGDASINLSLFAPVTTQDFITLLACDMNGNCSELSDAVQIRINNNNPPVSMSMSANQIQENSAPGTVICSLSGVDPDSAATFSYSLVPGAGSVDNGSFSISGDQLMSSASFDFESQPWYSIRIRCTDQHGAYHEQMFNISVQNLNEAPDDLSISATGIDENMPSGTAIGLLSSDDQDAGDSHSYALASGPGDMDNGFFSITGNQLESALSFDFETHSVFSIRVRSTDAGGLTHEKIVALSVNNINETPLAIAVSGDSIEENQAGGTLIAQLSTTDPDNADTHSYSLVAGPGDDDNASFNISLDMLYSSASFDYETKNTYSLRIRSTDASGLSAERNLIIHVTDLPENPTAVNDLTESGSGIIISPNPSDGEFKLILPSASGLIQSLRIYDALGRECRFVQSGNMNEIRIRMLSVSSGLYTIMALTQDGHMLSEKTLISE